MRYTTIPFALLLALQSFAQVEDCTKQINGLILDKETNEPLPFATVRILNADIGAISDEVGIFTLTNICEKEVDFEVRFLGYKTVVHHHDFRSSDHIDIDHVVYLATEKNLLESVVVEGQEVVGDMESMSFNRIDRSQLVAKTTSSLAAAIGDVQGVTMVSAGSNVQLPVIHGLYGNRILIINNGVKHGFQNWGSDHAPEIDITSADNISVLKGAAGVRYGPEALGGVVVVEGNPLKLSKKTYGGITAGYQSNGRGYNTNVYLGAGYKKLSYHLGANYVRIGDRHTPNYSLTNSGKEERSFNAGFRYHLPQWDFKLRYSYVDQDLALLRSSVASSGELFSRSISATEPLFIQDFSYNINKPKQNTNHHLASLNITWHSDLGKFELLLSQQVNLRQEFDVRRNADLPIIDLQLNTTDTRLEWDHPSLGGLEGTIGIQYFSQNNDNNPGTGTTPFVPNYNTYRYSAFLIENFQKGDNTFEFGLRLDHEYNSVRGRETNQDIFRNKFSFTNATVSLGFVRDLSSSWKLRTNLGSAWRRPNMAELYSFGQNGFKVEYGLWRYYFGENGDPRTNRVLTEVDEVVEAEKGFKWINELSHRKNANTLTITGYANFIKNFTFDRPLGVIGTFRGPMPAFIVDQTDAFFVGVDMTYTKTFNDKLKGTLGSSYLWNLNYLDNEGLINQPPININATLSWNTPLFFGLDYSKLKFQNTYTFRQFQSPRTISPEQLINGEVEINSDSEIFDFTDASDGYFLSHVVWEWKYDRIGGQFEVGNLFNTVYRDYLNQMRYFADEPGRNFLFTINYKF